ncbi:MAG: hypothetical protein U0Z70_17955 [Thermomicrobiales bacterium]
MDAPRFDRFARTAATRLPRRAGLGLLAGASLPLLGLASATDAKKKKKITLCLNGKTVKAPKKKAKKLLKQGATKGACVTCPTGRKLCNNTCIPTTDCCDCQAPAVCENGICSVVVIPRACNDTNPCFAFVTSQTFSGAAIGGLAGADAKCQTLATGAGLPGTYQAWLSDDTESAEFRFPIFFGPWRLPPNAVDGSNLPPVVATHIDDLTTCGTASCLKSAINRTETGNIITGSVLVWTNTLANGLAGTDSCSGWTSNTGNGLFGQTSAVDEKWTDSGDTFDCGSGLSLYCFEVAE